MKISRNWLQEFVELPVTLTPAEFSRTLTLSVCEVEGVEVIGEHLKSVVAAQVLTFKPHPDADKLRLVTLDYGAPSPIEVVCGASNFAVGDKVAYAGLGVELPGGFVIKKAKIRGIESLGMLCAEDELGFSEDHEGLFLLPQETQPGTPLAQLYPDQVDWVLEIDNKSVTHRPDLWGHYGFARELGAIYQKPLKPYPALKPTLGTGPCPIAVTCEVPELVPRYSGQMVVGLHVQPSPAAMRYRLRRVGLRPINNLVDVTNYVMLELGQPMHAFDGEKISGHRLVIRRAKPGEKVLTLYGKEVELSPDDLTLADGDGPSVVAGVIGGLHSGIEGTGTTRCFLEAANWNPVSVRKTAAKIGLRTDASQRFEKALDPATTELALWRALELLRATCPGLKLEGSLCDLLGAKIPAVQVNTSYQFINGLLGTDIGPEEIKGILHRLEFEVTEQGQQIVIEVPGHRRTKDISIPEDIAEEVGRIYGLSKIAPQAPLFPVSQPKFNRHRQVENRTKKALAALGFHEIYSYPLTDQKTEAAFGLIQDPRLVLVNPVVDHQDRMRTSLLPHLVQRVHENQKLSPAFKLFEISRVYGMGTGTEPVEPYRLVTALSTPLEPKNLGAAFYRLKADLIALLSHLQAKELQFLPLSSPPQPYMHPGIAAEIVLEGKKGQFLALGRIFALTPAAMRQFELKDQVVFAELDFDALFTAPLAEYRYEAPSKFPAVFLDLSLLVDQRLPYLTLKREILAFSGKVESVRFLDVYCAESLGEKKSLSVTVTFRSKDSTLTPEETKDLQTELIESLAKKGYQLR
ncbi:MAG: phenylalanine--tRNA ligase subunit beta [Candidatus Lambdaproteobacteria bacterium RIFOXYD1_FULL_56_27]|uniref:Phenylalanine--tRNA ligase beta subunit n=1 Tax=Candidatus Lambdaproteobacteria bacterium RIFOXYD2_FULL_56_26 TaxID=1817773 RepID=A0A1F6GYU2_9PROT|nr:MAG: phenylalanine--tRNA ligase subunit beta [Candidatus Lambdaproteobacteria bacterium RIFOXYC1_FULL_56_13]OGH03249.1 MAG: phenylalanine--tRNA ligase subunit beta [Candidatus Lambdaproteobacteria bacterium RIFOXYD2_FULL_56_26]OGH08186.1 MAG: phenylalanine--tRNA ligase subunit beta [Candidatus Lambdaproteobacteria bacterium RIFOXYD1_FULL_56_27]